MQLNNEEGRKYLRQILSKQYGHNLNARVC